MALRKATPVRWTPRGLTDALDGSAVAVGGMSRLQNLIPDPSTPGVFYPRPGITVAIDFVAGGFDNPGYVSLQLSVGNMVYGLVATDRNMGHDEPFVYDLDAAAFITVTGTIDGTTTPTSLATTGDWIPPTGDQVGVLVYITSPGFADLGGTDYFGWIDLTDPAVPTWNVGDTAAHSLGGVPRVVVAFNNRAYLFVDNIGYFTDPLTVPPTRTNAVQSVTLGATSPIVGVGKLPVAQTQGGILSSILPFKEGSIWQIAGDSALSNLSVNELSSTTGTQAPRSITFGSDRLFFMATDGLRWITQAASVSEAVVADVAIPFITASPASRASASYSQGVYRLAVASLGAFANQAFADYWFHTTRLSWSGPHTTYYDCASANRNGALISSPNLPGAIYQSDVIATPSSVYTELGSLITCVFATVLLPPTNEMAEKQVVETTLDLATVGGLTINVAAFDANTVLIPGGTPVVSQPAATSIWGQFNWGAANWQGSFLGLQPVPINWTQPLVFKRLQFQATFVATLFSKIGTLFLRYQVTGYMMQSF